ncbi:MAG: hypothetical protein EOM37_07550 [Proteobacteria bacterium]|nr:hypothetical protein [Pseudomonadota bacterium]
MNRLEFFVVCAFISMFKFLNICSFGACGEFPLIYSSVSNKKLQWFRFGFTLTEAAIVMAIVGLVLSGIWSAFSSVVFNPRLHSLEKNIGVITSNLHSVLGMGTAGVLDMDIEGADGAVMMSRIGVVPRDMWDNPNTATAIVHPWGGAVEMTALRINIDGDGVDIGLINLPQEACTDLLVRLTGPDRDVGLIQAGTTTASQNVAQMPIPLSTAANDCAGAENDVHLQYRLK